MSVSLLQRVFVLLTALVFQPVPGWSQFGEESGKSLPVLDSIDALLVHKDIPVIGGKWAGDIFIDLPVNDQPAGAAVTLRGAKLKYSRGFGSNWQLKLAVNYNEGGGFEVSDNYLVYNGWTAAQLTFGINDPPFSLESMSSSSSLTFMERALTVAALSERRSGGITFLKRTSKSILNAAVVLFNPSQENLREKGQAIVLHYVHSPLNLVGGRNIHLGGSLSYRLNADEKNTQFRSRPEIATANTYFVDTGEIGGTDRIMRASLEASSVRGHLSWQTELLGTRVLRDGSASVDFWGAYANISWFLSDDSRNYDFGAGQFKPLTPNSPLFNGGWGAFELAFRASYVDLTDEDVIGGEESNLSLGLNWYLNKKLRVMGNLIKVLDVDRPGSEFDKQNPLIAAVRLQWVVD